MVMTSTEQRLQQQLGIVEKYFENCSKYQETNGITFQKCPRCQEKKNTSSPSLISF